MDASSDSSRFRRLGRAVQAFLAHRDATPAQHDEVLARNDEVRDLLEPMLRASPDSGAPDEHRHAGQRFLGGFRLLREIGRGGMGVVYEAEEFALGRRVALKVLPNQPNLTARHIERFRREAAAAARLKHQGIVPVYSVGEVDGTHYFAMEYVEGKSLGQAIAEVRDRCGGDPARLTEPALGCIAGAATHEFEVAAIVAQAAEAVAAAHAGGVLHRDLKPHNILVDRQGQVRVVDFGLAKDLVRGSVSRSGEVAGTPHYMSPEQAQGGRGVDARTDVFALGVVLYELLTLRVPFAADTPHEVLHAILTREPESPRRSNPRLPRDLETICLKALERDVHYRYRTAGELAAELRRFLRTEPITARPPGSMTRLFKLVRRRKAAAVAVVLAFLVVVVGPLAFAVYQRSVRATLEAQESATARERDKARTNFSRARRLLEQQLERVQQLGREPGMEVVHRQMADDALAYYQEFLGSQHASTEDRDLELQALETHVLVARIHLTLGDHVHALAVIATAMTHIERARAAGASGLRWVSVHADLLRHRASARRHSGELPAATADLEDAAAMLEELLAADLPAGADHAARMGLAITLFDTASYALQDGAGSDVAAQQIERAWGLTAATAGIEASTRDQTVRLSILRKHAELLRRTGRHAAADEMITAAVRQVHASTAAGNDAGLRAALASVLVEHGSVLQALRRPVEAEAALQQTIALREQLARDFPRTQEHRHGLQVALYNLGLLLHSQHRNAEASPVLQRATAVIDELLAESPDSVVFAEQACMIDNLTCLVASRLPRPDPDPLDAAYRRATARHEELIAKHPQVTKLSSGLGAVLHNHAMWMIGHKQWDEGRGLLLRAIAAQRAAHEVDPRITQYRDFLYNHWQLLGQCELSRQDVAGAAVANSSAAALLPDRADVQVALAQRMLRCAALARAAGDATAARSHEDGALVMLARATAVEPTRAAALAGDAGWAPIAERPEFRALLPRADAGK